MVSLAKANISLQRIWCRCAIASSRRVPRRRESSDRGARRGRPGRQHAALHAGGGADDARCASRPPREADESRPPDLADPRKRWGFGDAPDFERDVERRLAVEHEAPWRRRGPGLEGEAIDRCERRALAAQVDHSGRCTLGLGWRDALRRSTARDAHPKRHPGARNVPATRERAVAEAGRPSCWAASAPSTRNCTRTPPA